MKKLLFGIDRFIQQKDKFKNLRFALLTNNAATSAVGILSRVALMQSGVYLVKLFSAEHGLTAQAEDGSFQDDIWDPITDLPVISLYGDRLKPSQNDLADVDGVLVDIPDVGCRFYTYLWTMTYVMEACATFKKSLFILDRPNPIGGNLDLAEGPMLDELHCSSFIGRWSMPIRHSCTLGELACYFGATRVKNLDLEIIATQNFKRELSAKSVNSIFSPPSPAIRDAETALLYPGMGLLEGINVNEGRGTEFPFKIFGAPWINASQLHKSFERLQIPGITSQAQSFKPSFGLYAKQYCHGLKFVVTDAFKFRPVLTGLKIIGLITSQYPEYCKERLYTTRANPTGKNHLDKLTGVFYSFEKIKSGEMTAQPLIASAWKKTLQPYLLYE